MNKQKEPELTDAHIRDLSSLQANCYEHLHRPMVVKAQGFKDEIWYICQECLDKYIKEHPELKKLIIAFRR